MDVVTKQKLAYNFLRTQILSGQFLPGQRIITGAVAQRIGTSGVPVREALLQLAADGLVEITPHVGAVVSVASVDELISVMETGAILEGYATALVHPHAAQVVGELIELNKAMDGAGKEGNWASFSRSNRQFHEAIYSRCPNSNLIETIHALWEKGDSLRSRTIFFQIPNRADKSVVEHKEIIRLLRDPRSNPTDIETAARTHKLNTMHAMKENIPSQARLQDAGIADRPE